MRKLWEKFYWLLHDGKGGARARNAHNAVYSTVFTEVRKMTIKNGDIK